MITFIYLFNFLLKVVCGDGGGVGTNGNLNRLTLYSVFPTQLIKW